jgi:hypothetical protein
MTLLVAVLAVAASVFAWWAASGWLRWKRRSFITVHTVDDRTIEGVLTAAARDGIVLTAAVYPHDGEKIPLAGAVFIPRHKVLFVQVTDASTDS